MIPLLFVHGTGVREPAFSATAERVQEALLGQARVTKCYWGEHLGSRLSMDGASIPDYTPLEDPPARDTEEDEVQLWQLLASDPLYELRLLSTSTTPSEPGFLIDVSPGQRLTAVAESLPHSVPLRELLARYGLTGSFDAVWPGIIESGACKEALAHAPEGLAEHRYAMARALVAAMALEARRRAVNGGLPLGYEVRAALVDRIVDDLGGKEYGILNWTWRNVLSGVSKDWGTRYMTRNRGVISDGTWPLAGDVLVYQAHGDRIRAFIREHIVTAGPGVVVLAHSLGGVACVELLAKEKLDVRLLITVGSQSPLLYEIGALNCLAPGEPLRDDFPRWVNVYDLRDLLAYVGERVFRGRVEDIRVDNGSAFPDSHSAYWTNPAVMKTIRTLISA